MKKSVLLLLIFSSLLGFSQTAEEYLINYKHEYSENNVYFFDDYVAQLNLVYENPETFELIEKIGFSPLNFTIDNTKQIIHNNDIVSVPLTCKQNEETGDPIITLTTGFYANLIKKENAYQLISITPPYTHYFRKKDVGNQSFFVLETPKYNYVNHFIHQHDKELTKGYTEDEIKSHYSNMLNTFMSLMDSNYIYVEGQEFVDTLALEFFVENSFERKFNHEDKIIHQNVKAYNNLENLQYWGNLFEMTDDFSLNAQLREKQEKAVAQDFTLVFKYDNSFPKPIFELIKIIPPVGLQWKTLTDNKFLLQLNIED
ncbi:MAG: hypothetical protein RQ875_11440 [Vicingaceae bacterium]|nr:hypothetical protein [Vicingaceae bacterium]